MVIRPPSSTRVAEASSTRHGPGRATVTAVVAYLAVTTLGFFLYLVISQVRGTSPWDEVAIQDNRSYQITATVLPLLNLAVWTTAAHRGFVRGRSAADLRGRPREPWLLGGYWLALVASVDLLAFVVPTHALALDPESFYLGQGPWIYLTYAAVLGAPLLARALALRGTRDPAC